MQATLDEMLQQIEQLKAHKELSDSTENRKQSLAIQTDIDRMVKDYDKMCVSYLTRLNSRDMEAAEQFMTDMSIHLSNGDKLYRIWRERATTYEFIESIKGFDALPPEQPDEDDSFLDEMGPPGRAKFLEMVDEAKKHFEAQISLADQMIPNKATILHVN